MAVPCKPSHPNPCRKGGTAAGATEGTQTGAPPRTACCETPALQPRLCNPLAVHMGRTRHLVRAATDLGKERADP